MAEITAALVKQLRETTGAGMMDCKKALNQTDGALDDAVDWLRKKGLAAAAKKTGRVAAEGLVGAATSGAAGAVVEVNSETDFVGRNETFQGFVAAVAGLARDETDDVESLTGLGFPGENRSVGEQLTYLVSTVGENMGLRRAARLTVDRGVVASYVHNALKPGLGKIGVLVALESSADSAKLSALGKQIAMHVAASSPRFLSRAEVGADVLDREREVLSDRARATGKPEPLVARIVEGGLRKFHEENCLLEQTYVMDPDQTVQKAVAAAAKQLGAEIGISGFARFALGEGIEKKETDFVAEVAAAAGS